MSLKQHEIESVVAELRALIGGRIQRIDLISLDQIILEIRCPGKTFRLLISAEPGLGRIHLVDRRPPKPSPPPNLQGVFRKWMLGKPICDLHTNGSEIFIDCPQSSFIAKLRAGKEVFRVQPQENEFSIQSSSLPETFPISDEVASKYRDKSASTAEDNLRQHLLRKERAALKKDTRLLKNLDKDAARLKNMEQCRLHGELLKPHLHKIKRGMNVFETNDWNGEAISVPLDPSLGPKSNLEALFRRAKKAGRGLPRVEERRSMVNSRIASLKQKISEIQDYSLNQLQDMTQSPASNGPIARTKAKASPSKATKLKTFQTVDGHKVYVGKGAKENDYLTLRVARGHDLWLHARGCPGAHVVLPLEKNSEASPEAFIDACHLAAFYSDRKTDSHVEILYTKAKFVRKSKGAAPGAVSVSKEKTINLRLESSRLNRLLGREDL